MSDTRTTLAGAVRSTSLAQALSNLRSEFAWRCADAADAALRFAQRLEPDIDATSEAQRAFDAGLAAGREEYAAMAGRWGRRRIPLDSAQGVRLAVGDQGRRQCVANVRRGSRAAGTRAGQEPGDREP